MGCSSSKEEDLPLVSLCRHRRDLIRAASDRRYDLAAAHASYFRALDRVGDALHRFVTEDLTAVPSPPSSPVLTLPPSEGKSKSKSDGGSSGNGNGIGDSRHLSSFSSSISLSSSSSGSDFSHSHLPEENADADSHLHFASRSGSELGSRRGIAQEGLSAYPPPPQFSSSFLNPNFYQDPVTGRFDYRQLYLDGGKYPAFVNPIYYPNPVTGGQLSNPSFYYMKKSATTPSTFYVDPNNMERFEYSNYSSYYYNDRGPTFGDERGNVADSSAGRQAPKAAVPPPPPPPPPPPAPEGSGWDFFNVFDSYEQYLMNVKGTLGSGPGSVSSPDSSEIREKEGIPDLEEETEPESFREVEKKKEVVGSSVGTSKAPPLDELVKEKTENIMNERVREEIAPSVKEEIFVRKKGVSFEVEGSIKTEESSPGSSLRSSLVTEESRSTDGIELHVHGTKDVVEAVEEIKEQFKSASGCGEQVARLLEVGKLRYRSRRTLLRGNNCLLGRVLVRQFPSLMFEELAFLLHGAIKI